MCVRIMTLYYVFIFKVFNEEILGILRCSSPTVGENIIATIKMRNNCCYPLKMRNNIGLFSIAPNLVIALPTLQ